MRTSIRDVNPVIRALRQDNTLKELVRRFDFKRIKMIIQYCSINQLINSLKRFERIKKRKILLTFRKNFKNRVENKINYNQIIAVDYILGFFYEFSKKSILSTYIQEWKCTVQEKNIVAEYFIEAFVSSARERT